MGTKALLCSHATRCRMFVEVSFSACVTLHLVVDGPCVPSVL